MDPPVTGPLEQPFVPLVLPDLESENIREVVGSDVESVPSDATASNLPGPGRNVGRLFDWAGGHLDSVIKGKRLDDAIGGRRVDTHSSNSIGSDDTAPNLPGAGRTVGILIDSLGSRLERFLNSKATRRGLGPTAIAKEIRHLRGHLEPFPGCFEKSRAAPQDSEASTLKMLIHKLLRYARSNLISTQLSALEEIVDLSIVDPFVRRIMAEKAPSLLMLQYKEPDLIIKSARAFGSIRDAYTHHLWSNTIADVLSGQSTHISPHLVVSLQNTLNHPDSSFIAARYLTYAMKALNGILPEYMVYDLWVYYLRVAVAKPSIIEWPNMDYCIKEANYDQYSTHAFISTRTLVYKFSGTLLREVRHIPGLLSTFFPLPDINFREIQINGFAEIEFGPYDNEEWMLDRRAALYSELLADITNTSSIKDQILFLGSLSVSTRRLLRNTLFMDNMSISYCHVLAWKTYAPVGDFKILEIPTKGAWKEIVAAMMILASHLESANVRDRALASFLITRIISRNRYNKLAFHLAAQPLSHPPVILPLPPNNDFYDLAGWEERSERSDCTTIHLKRFNNGRGYYIAYEPDSNHPFPGDRQFVEVDNMTFTTNDIMCMGVNGRDKPFDSTGHRPILMGYDSSGNANYVAVVRYGQTGRQYAFTCVTDGACTVTYIESESCRTRIAYEFKVLVLRRDPSDIGPPYPSIHESAVDPTGYLYWKSDIHDLNRVRWSGLDQEQASKLNMAKGQRPLGRRAHPRTRNVDIGLIPELDGEGAEGYVLTKQQLDLRRTRLDELHAMLWMEVRARCHV